MHVSVTVGNYTVLFLFQATVVEKTADKEATRKNLITDMCSQCETGAALLTPGQSQLGKAAQFRSVQGKESFSQQYEHVASKQCTNQEVRIFNLG